MERINKTVDSLRYQMRRASAKELPDSPSANGMSATDIKRALWAPMLGTQNSLLSEQDRIVDETNAAIGELDARLGEKSVTEGYFGKDLSLAELLVELHEQLNEALATVEERLLESVGDPALELVTEKKDLRGAVNELANGQRDADGLILALRELLGCLETGEPTGLVGDLNELKELGETVVGAIKLLDGRLSKVDTEAVSALVRRIDELKDSVDTIEERIGLQYDFTEIESAKGTLTLPSTVRRYAQITEIHGMDSKYFAYMGGIFEPVKNYPPRLVTDQGAVLFELPSDVLTRLTDFGYRGNYIYFDQGKAFYHQASRAYNPHANGFSDANYQNPPLEEGEEVIHRIDYTMVVIKLAAPIVTDISDYITADGIIDLGEAEYITAAPLVSEEEVEALSFNGYYNYYFPSVKILVEAPGGDA